MTGLQLTGCVFRYIYAFRLLAVQQCDLSPEVFLYDLPFSSCKAFKSTTRYFARRDMFRRCRCPLRTRSNLTLKGNGKGFPYSIPSVGPGADPGVQVVSPQVTVSHPSGGRLPLLSARPTVGLPPQPQSITALWSVPSCTAW